MVSFGAYDCARRKLKTTSLQINKMYLSACGGSGVVAVRDVVFSKPLGLWRKGDAGRVKKLAAPNSDLQT